MGLFRPSRERRGPDPYYRWKVALFTVGAAVAFVGMFGHHDELILVAVPILATGVGLRWLPRRGESAAQREDAEAMGEEATGRGPPTEPADATGDGNAPGSGSSASGRKRNERPPG